MGYYRPIGIWEACYCDGTGLENCGECNHIVGLCSSCKGMLFILRKQWVREPGDPPPPDPSLMVRQMGDEIFRLSQETATRLRRFID
jgi:hypothetical protein